LFKNLFPGGVSKKCFPGSVGSHESADFAFLKGEGVYRKNIPLSEGDFDVR
jgi:hypothetical protein